MRRVALLTMGIALCFAGAAARGEEAPKGDVPWPKVPDLVTEAVDGAKVSVDFKDATLLEALTLLDERSGVTIRPEEDVRERKVTAHLTDVTVRQALSRLAQISDCEIHYRGGRIVFSAKPLSPDDRVLRLLGDTVVSFTFNEQPVLEAIDFLETLGNVNIVLDRSKLKDPQQTVTLEVKNVPLGEAVGRLANQLKLSWVVYHGVVFISDEATFKKLAEEDALRAKLRAAETQTDRKVRARLAETVVSFTFNEQPVMEAIDFLQTLGSVNIVPDRRKFTDPKQAVTLRLANRPLEVAIALIVEQLGLDYAIQDGVVFISDTETLKKRAQRKPRVFLDEAPTESQRNAYERMKDTVVSFTFNEQPACEGLDFLATLGGLPIAYDRRKFEDPPKTVTIKLNNVPMTAALTLVTEQLGMTWGFKGNAIRVAGE